MSFSPSSEYERLGIAVSVVGHVVCLAIIVGFRLWEDSSLRDVPAYSVTIEPGRSLGGRSQVAKEKTNSVVSPSKAALGKDAPTPIINPKAPTAAPATAVPPTAIPATAVPPTEVPPTEVPPTVAAVEPTVAQPTQPPKQEPEVPEPTAVVVEEAMTPVPTTVPTTVPTPVRTVAPTAKAAQAKATTVPTKKPAPENVDKAYQNAMQRYLGDSSQARGGTGFGAARVGGRGYGGGVVKPPEFFEYLQTIKDTVRREWRWYDNRAVLVVEVELRISPDGMVTGQRIVRSSGNPDYDDSVYRAIKAASPLPPPPPSVYRDFEVVRVIFDARND